MDAALPRPATGNDPHRAVDEAERIVEEVATRWDHRHGSLADLLDHACAALAARADHELRQVLAQLSTDLELLRRHADEPDVNEERFERMFRAIERASQVVATHLDRTEIAKMIIHVEGEELDLADLLERALQHSGIPPNVITASVEPVRIEGDREKLGRVLAYLVRRFDELRVDGEQLRLELEQGEAGAEGRVGIDPSSLTAEKLIDELEAPLDIEAVGIDLPYARAVIERHGGTLFVAQMGADGLGLGFELPSSTKEDRT